MRKIFLIAKREFITRARKRSFLLLTLLGPVFLAFMMIVPIWIATSGKEKTVINVLDESNAVFYKIPETSSLHFAYFHGNLEMSLQALVNSGNDALLYIPSTNSGNQPVLYSKGRFNPIDKNYIEQALQNIFIREQLKESGKAYQEIKLSNAPLGHEWKNNTSDEAAAGAGLFFAVMVYFFIFLYGVQVMRSVIEEKANRIVEVIISSVKPFELLMGKILGIAGLSLFQFLVWMTGIFSVTFLLKSRYGKSMELFNESNIESTLSHSKDAGQAFEMYQINSALGSIDLGFILPIFLFFFFCGYLLYSSIFAIIGSAVDNDTETQQFVVPFTFPLLGSMFMIPTVLENPDGAVSFWLSIIPFTSPVIMLVRATFDVPAWQLALSMALLFITFIFTTYLAGRIYRIGILMYGKKASFGELWKWMRSS